MNPSANTTLPMVAWFSAVCTSSLILASLCLANLFPGVADGG
jgi:hypothetical protein